MFAGDLFHPEVESVPEQTWSSAGLLSAAVHGLLGVEVRALENGLRLAPHLPATWLGIGVEHLRVGAASLDLRIRRDAQGIELEIVNTGPSVSVDFAPAIALGAVLGGATVDGVTTAMTAEAHAQDQHAQLRFTSRPGRTTAGHLQRRSRDRQRRDAS